MTDEQLVTICALLVERQVQIEARTEVMLKTLAHFVGTVTQQEWEPMFRDQEQQVKEIAELRRREIEADLKKLRDRL
jgi:hypothetical protein